jgi:hypothetical protein
MADNIDVTEGSGRTVAADEISSALHQRVKISLGADGSATDALGGAGNVAAGVQRVTLAADDPGVASLAVVDDWDESDRAKVNLIVGQAGVAAGAGAVGATVPRVTVAAFEYETVAASQTDQMCGSTGAAGDLLVGLLVVPASVDAGAVSIEDGSTNTTVFTGGTDSVTTLIPFFIPLNILSASGGWEITTGADVSVIAVGQFT